jgi:hypothetical protein
LFLLLGCHWFWQAVEVYLIGRLRFQAGVWSGRVVEVDVAVPRQNATRQEPTVFSLR